nr:KR domain-containing protein [Micromonospora sp. DSM 115978]
LATAVEHVVDGAVAVSVLDRGLSDVVALGRALGVVHGAGWDVDWSSWFPVDPSPRVVDLPTYPFQRQRFWLPDLGPPGAAAGSADEGEGQFWAAVERADLDGLSKTLGLPDAEDRRSSFGAVLPILSRWRRERRERSVLDSWRYRIEWRPVRITPSPAAVDGSWLVVRWGDTGEEWVQPCVDALTANGGQVRHLDLDPDVGSADLAESLRTLLATQPVGPVRVLSVICLARSRSPELAGTLTLLQALVETGAQASLWTATRGAVSVDGDGPEDPAQARVWGLGRVAALEHPDVWGGLVDLPPDIGAFDPGLLRAVLAGDTSEDQVALRPAGAFGRRMVPDPVGAGTPPPRWKPRGAVLVTGGMDGPASGVARWLVESGAERVLLLDPAGSLEPGVHGLSGVTVVDRVPNAVDIGTVVHASVPGELAPLAEVEPDDLERTVRARLAGILETEERCRLRAGDTVVYFSSVAAAWGGRDHGAYAAVNAHLEALIRQRRANGIHAVSVAWGMWDVPHLEADPGGRTDEHAARARRQGLVPLEPRLALSALHRALDGDDPYHVVADVEWARFAPLFDLTRSTRLFDEVPAAMAALRAARATDGGSAPEATEVLRRELATHPESERHGILLAMVRTHVAAALRYENPDAVDRYRSFRDLGFDSLVAVDLRNRLRAATGLRLAATLVFDHPTPDALANRLLAEVLPADPDGAAPALGHLDDLTAALAALSPEVALRSGLVARLQALSWKYASPSSAAPDPAGEAAGLADATADEMFALIDRELGT